MLSDTDNSVFLSVALWLLYSFLLSRSVSPSLTPKSPDFKGQPCYSLLDEGDCLDNLLPALQLDYEVIQLEHEVDCVASVLAGIDAGNTVIFPSEPLNKDTWLFLIP